MDPKETSSPAAALPPVEQLTPDQVEAELKERRERKDAREADRKAKRAAQELDYLRLVDKYEEELGPLGRDFAVLDVRQFDKGFIVVKRPPAVAHQRFMAAIDKADRAKKPITEDITVPYVMTGLVHPSPGEFKALAADRAAIPTQVAELMMGLVGVDKEEQAGK